MLNRAHRTLYLIAYDIADPRRLEQVCRYLTGWKVAGQKSCFECWLTPSERQQALRTLRDLILPSEDRIHLFQLDPRQSVRCHGVARTFTQGYFTVL